MSWIPILEWIRDLPVAVAIRQSAWMLPAIEAAHLLGYAGVIGTAIAIDLRILGGGLRKPDGRRIADQLAPWTLGSLVVSAITGALLFSYKPLQFAANGALPYKISLAAAAIIFHYAGLRPIVRKDISGRALRIAAICSLVLWTSVVLAGMALSLENFDGGGPPL